MCPPPPGDKVYEATAEAVSCDKTTLAAGVNSYKVGVKFTFKREEGLVGVPLQASALYSPYDYTYDANTDTVLVYVTGVTGGGGLYPSDPTQVVNFYRGDTNVFVLSLSTYFQSTTRIAVRASNIGTQDLDLLDKTIVPPCS